MKNIIVCMKQVLDPEAPLSLFKIDSGAKEAIMPNATPPVLSPFDENALEAALQIKDTGPATITVLSLGKKLTRAVVRASLAAGADRLFLLEDQSFSNFDTALTAQALTAAIRKIGQYDLILCGLQAADTNAGQVGTGIASLLGLPCITFARKVQFNEDGIQVEKVVPDGYEVISVPAPAVVTVSYEVGALREPGVEAFMAAGKKPMTVWNAQALGIEPANSSLTSFVRMYPPAYSSQCEFSESPGPADKAAWLVARLKDTKVI